MNITSRACWPRKSSRRTSLPETTAVRAKSGAVGPSSSMVDSVSAMENSPCLLITHEPVEQAAGMPGAPGLAYETWESTNLPLGEHLLDPPECLTGALFILNQREADVGVAVVADAYAGGDGGFGFR